MDNKIQNPAIAQLISGRVTPPSTVVPPAGAPGTSVGTSFESVLQDRLKVSAHASTRLQSRGIQLGADDWKRVMEGVDRAAAKGAKESLVMVDNVALVVSVKNRTVITAVDKENLKQNVFTNIDSAVIV